MEGPEAQAGRHNFFPKTTRVLSLMLGLFCPQNNLVHPQSMSLSLFMSLLLGIETPSTIPGSDPAQSMDVPVNVTITVTATP